ncbi:hypothetical protein IKJ53_06140, partial [bacterium]|nr:hypothetical protein [bacterium]
ITVWDYSPDARINITDVNLLLADSTDLMNGVVFHVLKGWSNAQLVLPQSVIDSAKTALPVNVRSEDMITKAYRDDGSVFSFVDANGDLNVNYSDAQSYGIRVKEGVASATLALTTTNTQNDSISVSLTGTTWNSNVFERTDILYDLLSYDTTNTKTFRFNSASDNLNLLRAYDNLQLKGDVNILGVYDSSTMSYSTINGLDGVLTKFIITVNSGVNLTLSDLCIGKITSNTQNTPDIIVAKGGFADFNNINVSSTSYRFISNSGTVKSLTGLFNTGWSTILNNYGGVVEYISGAFKLSGKYGNLIFNLNGKIGYIDSSISDLGNKDRYKGGIVDAIIYNSSSTEGNTGGLTNKGVVYNLKDIVFYGNYSSYSKTISGAALSNSTTAAKIYNFEDIDFINNYLVGFSTSTSTLAHGAAIKNENIFYMGIINADFIGNYMATNIYSGRGGAIYNIADIGYSGYNDTSLMNTVFANNYIVYTPKVDGYAQGGAIYNSGNMPYGFENVNFIGNYIKSNTSTVDGVQKSLYGGAVYNTGTLPIMKNVHFYGNYLRPIGDYSYGGAIYTEKPL